jgi:hypothetical protein
LPAPALSLGLKPQVDVVLGDQPLADPLPLYAPLRQPLPNSPIYGDHLLEQSRRLVLGQERLTLVLVDDAQLRLQLTSGLAGDFGSRVVHECTSPEGHGVLSASWSWWLRHQEQLPVPGQMVVALLPRRMASRVSGRAVSRDTPPAMALSAVAMMIPPKIITATSAKNQPSTNKAATRPNATARRLKESRCATCRPSTLGPGVLSPIRELPTLRRASNKIGTAGLLPT